MIDEDFHPDRIQMRALGHLLVVAQNAPQLPAIREHALYTKVYERYVGSERQSWLTELLAHRLVSIRDTGFRVGDAVGEPTIDVSLTPEGTYYSIARAFMWAESARTPTDDFPTQIVDAPWAIQGYYTPDGGVDAPRSDEFIRFETGTDAFREAVDKIDELYRALKADNEIGANSPLIRDEKLAELQAIRAALEKGEGWRSRFIMMGWGTLGFLATHFADRPVGFLADQAWHALQAIIGLH